MLVARPLPGRQPPPAPVAPSVLLEGHCPPPQQPGMWPGAGGKARVPPQGASLTIAFSPDKQGHALQPLHVARRHMPGTPVVPLPVLIERVNLHPPSGVGHRAARGPGQRPRWRRPGRGAGTRGSQGGRTPASGGFPGLTAAAGRRGAAVPPAWPAPGPELWAPVFPRLRLLSAIVQARQGRPPREGRAALYSLPAPSGSNSGRRSLPCSRLRHDLREAASRAAAASSGRRRHVFLPYTWPCHRSQWLRSAPLLQISQAEGRLLLLQLLPLRGRLREPPGARALLPPGSPFPFASATASSVFLTQPKPPPSWFAPQ